MTVEELYNWAVNHNAEGYNIEIQCSNNEHFCIARTLYESDIEIDRLHEEITL